MAILIAGPGRPWPYHPVADGGSPSALPIARLASCASASSTPHRDPPSTETPPPVTATAVPSLRASPPLLTALTIQTVTHRRPSPPSGTPINGRPGFGRRLCGRLAGVCFVLPCWPNPTRLIGNGRRLATDSGGHAEKGRRHRDRGHDRRGTPERDVSRR